MIVSSARVASLIELSRLEAELTTDADRAMAAEDVEIFIDVLWEESTKAGHIAYNRLMEDLPDDEYPWTAVRAVGWDVQEPDWSDILKSFVFAPPAMALAANRRPELEPELPDDELPDADEEGSGYQKLYRAWYSWDTNMMLRAIGPVGWLVADDWEEIGEAAGEAAEEAVEDARPYAKEAWEAAKEAAEAVADTQKQVAAHFADVLWTTIKPIAIGAGAIAGVGLVAVIGYGVATRRR